MKSISKLFMNLALVGGLAGLGACASITSLTTAKTLKGGTSEWAVAGTYSNLKLNQSEEDIAKGDVATTAPGVDVQWRYGLTDDDEIGLRAANTLTYFIGDYKRALVKGSDFGLSIGAGIGGTQYSIGTVSNTVLDFYVPTVFADFYVSDSMTIFAAPKFMFRMQMGDVSSNMSQLAVSGGMKWGKDSGVILEGGWSKAFVDGAGSGWQVAAGYFF